MMTTINLYSYALYFVPCYIFHFLGLLCCMPLRIYYYPYYIFIIVVTNRIGKIEV